VGDEDGGDVASAVDLRLRGKGDEVTGRVEERERESE